MNIIKLLSKKGIHNVEIIMDLIDGNWASFDYNDVLYKIPLDDDITEEELDAVMKKEKIEHLKRELSYHMGMVTYIQQTLDDLLNKETLHPKTILEDREWNHYFDEGTEVIFDENLIDEINNDVLLSDDFKKYIGSPTFGKKGIVKKCYRDLHAFGMGSIYFLNVEIDGELITGLPAWYFIEYK